MRLGDEQRPIPPSALATITRVLDTVDPTLRLARLVKPVTVLWSQPGPGANYAATSTDEYVWINGDTCDPASEGWAESVVHELVHVLDKQLLDDAARARVMATLTREGGLPPVWGLDASVPYPQRAGEAFAETVARHLWYAVALDAGPSADLGVWGAYSCDPATALPVMLAAL